MPAAVEHFDISDEESQIDATETQADDAFEWLASTGDFCPGEKVRQSRPGKIVRIMLTALIMTQFALLTPAGGWRPPRVSEQPTRMAANSLAACLQDAIAKQPVPCQGHGVLYIHDGHPDKTNNQIPGGVPDASRKEEPKSKVACEIATKVVAELSWAHLLHFMAPLDSSLSSASDFLTLLGPTWCPLAS
jgi:hypothetical protein